jgi:hypothetical protein
MKHIKLYEEFVNESQSYSDNYDYKDDTLNAGGKKTKTLILGEDGWKKVKNLFDSQGNPKSDEIKNIPGVNGTSWDLYAHFYNAKVFSGDDDNKGTLKNFYRIYGKNEESTFGDYALTYRHSLGGNKQSAVKVFDYFINKYLK